MTEQPTFEMLADELEQKVKGLGKLGLTMKFVFIDAGNVFIDAKQDLPVLTRNEMADADFTVTGPLKVWLDLRAKKIAPHVAAMTGKIKFSGDLVRGLSVVPKMMTVL